MFSLSQYDMPPEAAEKIATLTEVLLDPNPQVLRRFSESGQLAEIIPQWGRLTGERNTQHNTHHFPLDDHTLKVVEKTKASSYYRNLSEYQRFMATLAALLHDIDKNTGPLRLRNKLPIDKLHPIKSAELSRVILEAQLSMPPKAVQRIYTLIHHHQVFGRLFVLFKEAMAGREWLQRIAVKVRNVGVLNCLVALSEGDIRAVQRGDAFFTPAVANLLAEYAAAVEEEIRSFRGSIPLFPLTLEMDWANKRIALEKSACFAISAPTWEALMAKVNRLSWGGAVMLPYYRSLQKVMSAPMPCHALVRFLPEDIAYWGQPPSAVASLEDYPLKLSMDVFYGLLLGEPFHPEALSPVEAQVLKECKAHALGLKQMLQSLSEAEGYVDWTHSIAAFDEAWFEPSDLPLPVDPLSVACDKAYQVCFPELPSVGICTRPILMGFLDTGEQTQAFASPWKELNVFRGV